MRQLIFLSLSLIITLSAAKDLGNMLLGFQIWTAMICLLAGAIPDKEDEG